MRSAVVHYLTMVCISVLAGLLLASPGRAFTLQPPSDSLAGLTPGVSILADAERNHGVYSMKMPGEVEGYAGGRAWTNAYYWNAGPFLGRGGLVVETWSQAKMVSAVMVDRYPGLATSRGLTTMVPDYRAVELYGLPDYAYEFNIRDTCFRELYYVNQGLLAICYQVNGRMNWTITTMILTYPTNLRNAICDRCHYAQSGYGVEDITDAYRVWAWMTAPSK